MKEKEYNQESVFTDEDLKYINEPFTPDDIAWLKQQKKSPIRLFANHHDEANLEKKYIQKNKKTKTKEK